MLAQCRSDAKPEESERGGGMKLMKSQITVARITYPEYKGRRPRLKWPILCGGQKGVEVFQGSTIRGTFKWWRRPGNGNVITATDTKKIPS